MRVRVGTAADVEAVRAIAHATWPSTFGDILAPDQIEYMLAWMYDAERLTEQLTTGGQGLLLAGSAGAGDAHGFAMYEPHYRPATTKLHKLYVLPEGHRRGTGRALATAVAKAARAAGDATLRLDVNYLNPATRFYERLGFRKVDEVTTEIGRGYLMEDYVYELSL